MFADDVTILATAPPPKGSQISPFRGAEQKAQTVVDVVQKWSVERKISLNEGKSEVSTFSRNSKDAKGRPAILVGAKAIKFNPTPRLLGTILDQQLMFTPHMDELSRRVGPSFRMLRAASHSEWGWPKNTLTSLYHAFVSSHLSYAGAGWQPYICAKNQKKLNGNICSIKILLSI